MRRLAKLPSGAPAADNSFNHHWLYTLLAGFCIFQVPFFFTKRTLRFVEGNFNHSRCVCANEGRHNTFLQNGTMGHQMLIAAVESTPSSRSFYILRSVSACWTNLRNLLLAIKHLPTKLHPLFWADGFKMHDITAQHNNSHNICMPICNIYQSF